MRNMKKAFAVVLSASMVMGMAVPAMAATTVEGGTTGVDIPIYSLDIDKVVVPTTYEVAFNPGGLTVKTGTGASDTSTDQILSRNFGIINQSSKAKVVTVGLKIEDKNTDSPIKFMGSAADVTSAGINDFAIYLEAVPADSTEVKVGTTPAAADDTTTAADLVNVTMMKATGAAVPLSVGENELQFILGKATYSPDTGKDVTLGTTTGNDVSSNYVLTDLAAGGKGITAFTLTGSMKETAEWHTLTDGISITPTYTLKTVEDSALDNSVKAGTGAVYANPAPQFTSNAVGKITYTKGSGDDALASITSITMVGAGDKAYDGFHALGNVWGAATHDEANGVVTFDAKYISGFVRDFPNDTTKEATITYTRTDGESATATVEVKLK